MFPDGYSNHVRGADRVDFMYVDALTAEDLFRGAQRREVISGVEMNVAKPEHLSAMKAIAIKHNPRRGWRDLDDGELANLPEPTPADIAALDRAERHNVMTQEEYLAFLLALTKDVPASRETDTPDEPFEL